MKPIENLLRRVIGLDPGSVGSALIEDAVRSRMLRCGVDDPARYLDFIQAAPGEWDELVESIVVTETWFFRDRRSFTSLIRHVQREWLPAHPAGLLRLLSIPCASGEEPYSLAMALSDAGLPSTRLHVEGIDLHRRMLDCARRGVYSRNSFRGSSLAFRARHFRERREGWELHPGLRRQVRFRQGNLLAGDFTTRSAVYDYVFCRNLLIYLDPAARRIAFERLNPLLSPSGLLFVGPAEIPLAIEFGFAPGDSPGAFACRKPGYAGTGIAAPALSSLPAASAGNLKTGPARKGSPADLAGLDAAARLADEGRLEEAAELCHDHLRRFGATARAYYLLGLVHDAGGQSKAADYYRRALYLDPHCRDALWQLALLAERSGELAQAGMLRRRARRAAELRTSA